MREEVAALILGLKDPEISKAPNKVFNKDY